LESLKRKLVVPQQPVERSRPAALSRCVSNGCYAKIKIFVIDFLDFEWL
jgi:hypothetical protein